MTPQRRPSASSPPAGRTRATPRLSCRSRRSGLSGCRSSLYGCPWGRRRRTLPGGFRWPCSGSPPCRPRPPGPRQCRSGRGRRCGSTRSLALWCPRPSPLPILSWGRSRRSWDREPRRPAPVCPAEGLLHQAAGLLFVLFLRGHAALLPSPVFPDLYRPGSSFLGVALRLPGEVDPDVGLLSHDPGVVPRTDYVNVPGTEFPLGAVVVDEVHPTRHHVPRVQYLATIRPHDGLDVLGPTPPWLQGESPRRDLVDAHYVDLAVVEAPGLVGGLDALDLQGFRIDRGAFCSFLPLRFGGFAGLGSRTGWHRTDAASSKWAR